MFLPNYFSIESSFLVQVGINIEAAGKATKASGMHMFKTKVKGKDWIFVKKGVSLKKIKNGI